MIHGNPPAHGRSSAGIYRIVARLAFASIFALTIWISWANADARAHDYGYSVEKRGDTEADFDRFREIVDDTLGDIRGWTLNYNVGYTRVSSGEDFSVILASPEEVDAASRYCSPEWSCRVGDDVLINDRRWRRTTSTWPLSRKEYRHYVVNHEVGHWLGLGHAACPGEGETAPVMMQQSKGLEGCDARVWPKFWERDIVAGDRGVFGWPTPPAGAPCTISGTPDADDLIGNHHADVICGFGGNDVLRGKKGYDVLGGGGGNDVIGAGAQADYVDGGAGDDEIRGWAGDDRIIGGPGDDLLIGHEGQDELRGRTGEDVLRGGGYADYLGGGSGADELHGGWGGDRLLGWAGDDLLIGWNGEDTLIGGEGADVLRGKGKGDRLSGNENEDLLEGGRGPDILFGGRRDDLLRGGSGDDLLNGQRGEDTCRPGSGDDEVKNC